MIGAVDLRGAQVDGLLRCVTGTFGVFYLGPMVTSKNDTFEIGLTYLGHLEMRNVIVKDDIQLYGLEIGFRKVSLMQQMGNWLDRGTDFGILIENSEIGGDVITMPRERRMAQHLGESCPEPLKRNPAFRQFLAKLDEDDNHGSRIVRTVAGDLRLRANKIEGLIELSGLTVLGDIMLADSEIGIDLLIGGRRSVLGGEETGLCTRCTHIDLEKIVCQGDVDLSGLSVQKQVEAGGREGKPLVVARGRGGLILRDAKVSGDVRLVDADRPDDEAGQGTGVERAPFARCEGKIDMSALTANKVTLTGENVVATASDGSADEARLVLERARLSRLQIWKPTPSAIDLTAIDVARWDFGGTDPGTDTVDVAGYEATLGQMKPIDLGVWTSVETKLRDQGLDDEANRIYLAMRRQLRGRKRGWQLRADSFLRATTGYGTSVRRVVVGLLLAWAVLFGVLVVPSNVEPTVDLIQAYGNCESLVEKAPSMNAALAPCERLSPDFMGYDWTAAQGFTLALRYGVPIIDLFGHQEWKASQRGIAVRTCDPAWSRLCPPPDPSIPRERLYRLPFSADLLAVLISLAGWIAWPILLIYLGGKIIRGQRR